MHFQQHPPVIHHTFKHILDTEVLTDAKKTCNRKGFIPFVFYIKTRSCINHSGFWKIEIVSGYAFAGFFLNLRRVAIALAKNPKFAQNPNFLNLKTQKV